MWSSSSVLEMHGQKIYSLNTKEISLIQDLHFPTCSQYICITPSQDYIISSGVYPPQLHIHSTGDLSLKCSRGLKQDCHRICLLEDGYEKILLGCSDRWIEVHSGGGEYWKGRSSGCIRDIIYNQYKAEAFVAMGNGICGRLGLEEGRWMQEIGLQELNDVNSVIMMNGLELGVFGGGEYIGKMSLWDWRLKEFVVRGLDVSNGSVTSLFNDGFRLYVGDEHGGIGVRDIRMLKDEIWRGGHQYSEPVVRICRNGEWIVSSDRVGVRVWRDGKVWTEWEPEGGVNWMEVVEGSGMVLIAGEKEEIGVWFVPGMGVAAKWGQWIEGMTEEMEREGLRVKQELKFVGEEELEGIDIQGLIDKGVIRRYLHGYLMQVRLYQRMREAKEPVIQNPNQNKNKQDRIVIEKRGGRKRVNEEYKDMLQERRMINNTKKMKKNDNKQIPDILEDDRFKDMFTQDKFKVDFTAKEYIQSHPGVQQKTHREEEWVEEDEQEEEQDKRIMRSNKGKDVPFEQRIRKGKQNKIVKVRKVMDRKSGKGKRGQRKPFKKDMKVISKALA